MLTSDSIVPAQANARLERLRYDGFRIFLQGRPPTEALAQAFARHIVARSEQGKYGYPAGEKVAPIARDLGYWVLKT